jgi:hypothetical protein
MAAQRPSMSSMAQIRLAYGTHGYAIPQGVSAQEVRQNLVDELIKSLLEVTRNRND